jgi:YfiH family protein
MPTDMEKVLSSVDKNIRFSYMDQVHSPTVHFIDDHGVYEGDGLMTKSDDMMLVVKTADCMPLVFYSREEDVIGVIHMGWKSAAAGILENIKHDLSTFKVYAGVALRKCCYAVGEEFFGYSRIAPFLSRNEGKVFFDPVSFSRETLMEKGLKEADFMDTGICSYCSDKQFASRRRMGGLYSKTLSFIVKTRP